MPEFEWYSEKERINVEKHGIDLAIVKKVFDDPFRIVQYDVDTQSVVYPGKNAPDE
jgi:uncharacterized DUF497 family protein